VKKEKIIFITSFHGLLSRVLGSGLIDELLKKKNFKIVIFVYDFKKEYYKAKFKSKRIIIETVDPKTIPRFSKFFRSLSFMLLHTNSMNIKFHAMTELDKKLRRMIYYKFLSNLGRFSFIRFLFRSANYFLASIYFSKYFSEYNPDLVFSTDIGCPLDVQMLIEAKKRKVGTISMVRSWDNLTSKGIMQVFTDKLIVQNEIMMEEAKHYNSYPVKNIRISGLPHYDILLNTKRMSRDKYLEKLDMDKRFRYILFISTGDRYADVDYKILNIVQMAIKDNKLPRNLKVMVRLPPSDTVNMHELKLGENFYIDQPGRKFENKGMKDNEMTVEDCLGLADSIYHSELVISGPSTLLTDAPVFGKPVVAVGFDGEVRKSYYNSMASFCDYEHIQNLIRIKSVKVGKSKEEFINHIREYLNDPSIDERERKIMLSEQFYKLDGKSFIHV